MSLYPKDEEVIIFGEKLKFPGLKDGKFTNGSFTDPKQLASFIPAETINLILDNLEEVIKSVGLEPNNESVNQLKEALSLRTNNIVLSERLEKLINIESQSEQLLTPDTFGILYSQTINLKEALADKIKQKKENIKIRDWNIVFVPSSVDYTNDTKFDMPHNLIFYTGDNIYVSSLYPFETEVITTPFCLLHYLGKDDRGEGNRFTNNVLFIQIADELTEDIRNIRSEKFIQCPNSHGGIFIYNHLDNVVQKYKAAALQTVFSAANGAIMRNFYFAAISDIYSASTSCIYDDCEKPSTGTDFVIEKINGYFSAVNRYTLPYNIEKTPPLSINSMACSRYDSTLKLFYGDEIKINIASIFDYSYYMRGSCQFDVEVRYSIIGK